MDSLSVSLVYQYLSSTNSSVAEEFKRRYQPGKADVTWMEVVSKWKDEQLVRGLVYEHLKQVTPVLAKEFSKAQCSSFAVVPEKLLKLIEVERRARNPAYQSNSPRLTLELKEENCHRLGSKKNMFSKEETARLQYAITGKEDVRLLAAQMGRSYSSVQSRIYALMRAAGLKKGKFTIEEVERIKQGIEGNEDYKQIAAELGRMQVPVLQKMRLLKTNPGPKGKVRASPRRFSTQEDFIILDRIIPQLKKMNISTSGFLTQSAIFELGTELHRSPETVKGRWERYLQPWLLQHLTGTSGFRVERMLTRLVADKFRDHRGIDWQEIVSQHKEFAGHTSTSLRQIYHKVIKLYKEKSATVTVEDVAAFAERAYQPGREKKEMTTQVEQREEVLNYVKRKVKVLGIDVVI